MTVPTEPLTSKQAAIALQFLQRTQMQGAEMPAYVDLFNTLTALAGQEAETPCTAKITKE